MKIDCFWPHRGRAGTHIYVERCGIRRVPDGLAILYTRFSILVGCIGTNEAKTRDREREREKKRERAEMPAGKKRKANKHAMSSRRCLLYSHSQSPPWSPPSSHTGRQPVLILFYFFYFCFLLFTFFLCFLFFYSVCCLFTGELNTQTKPSSRWERRNEVMPAKTDKFAHTAHMKRKGKAKAMKSHR